MKKTPQPQDVATGQKIRIRRQSLRMSQEDLATRIGLTFQQVQKYEKGTNRVGVSRLHQIAAALKCEPASLISGDHSTVTDPLLHLISKPGARELLESFNRISRPDLAGALVNLARTMTIG